MDSVEQNEMNIVGVIPTLDMESLRQYPRIPDAGTQVVATGAANNGTTTVYTVTAGKTLYLCNASYSGKNESGGAGNVSFRIYTGAAALWYALAITRLLDDTGHVQHFPFPVPLEIPAGYYFTILSSAVNLYANGAVHGFEI